MKHTSIHNRLALPTEFQILLGDYPRAAWPDHPNFAQSIQNWMGAHTMFRQLGKITTQETERFLDKASSDERFAQRMGYFGNQLVQNLHGHHNWEDRDYFPELSAADPRFDRGLDMLEADHQELDKVLDQFTRSANRTLQLIQLDRPQAYEEAALLKGHCEHIKGFLARHLEDEEDLIVPILLHHKMRG